MRAVMFVGSLGSSMRNFESGNNAVRSSPFFPSKSAEILNPEFNSPESLLLDSMIFLRSEFWFSSSESTSCISYKDGATFDFAKFVESEPRYPDCAPEIDDGFLLGVLFESATIEERKEASDSSFFLRYKYR